MSPTELTLLPGPVIVGSHLRASDWRIDPHVTQRDAVAAIERWHYAHSAPNTGVARHGLRWAATGDLLGVALWLPPTINAARSIEPCNPHGVLTLSRLAIAPDVPTNGASFLLGRSMRLLDRDRWPTLVTYADTGMGHTGAIYRATNWRYDGETPAGDTWRHTTTGEIRGRKRGARNLSAEQMRALGFERRPNMPKLRFVHRGAA